MRVLIANRGEIARRIERTCLRLGHEAVGVYVDGDAGSARALRHSPVEVVPSYLDQRAIVEAAQRSGHRCGAQGKTALFSRAPADESTEEDQGHHKRAAAWHHVSC